MKFDFAQFSIKSSLEIEYLILKVYTSQGAVMHYTYIVN